MRKNLSIVCMLLAIASGIIRTQTINHEILAGAKRMVGPDVNTGNIIGGIGNTGTYQAHEFGVNEINAKVNHAIGVGVAGGSYTAKPFSRIGSMQFGQNTKVHSLTFYNQITSGPGSISQVVAVGTVGVREGGRIKLVTSVGIAAGRMQQQYNVQTVRKCKRILFWNKCHNENINVPRGLYQHELDAVTNKLQRLAALGMQSSISASTKLSASEVPESLSADYLAESNSMRKLYTYVEYDSTDVNLVDQQSIADAVNHASQAKVTDPYFRQRIGAVAAANPRSNFLMAVDDRTLLVVGINKVGAQFNVKLSRFFINGRLPNGAFASSAGSWSLERAGQGANPSIQAILAIFPALKA